MSLVWSVSVDKHTACLSQTEYRIGLENIALRIFKGQKKLKKLM